jgi:NAD+ diphosphatase
VTHSTSTDPSADNAFAGNPLDRASHLRNRAEWIAERLKAPETLLVPVWRTRPFLVGGRQPEIGWLRPGLIDDLVAGGETVFLGLDGDVAHFAVEIPANRDPENSGPLAGLGTFADLRQAVPNLAPGEASILAQAKAMVDWHARHRFCAQCGAPTEQRSAGYSRRCTREGCGAEHFPRTDPVVIMLAYKGDKALLGRQKMFPPGMYSALAGFIEPGETIEEAVRREVKEEAGIDVGMVRYHSTQPWPFPSSLMIGCLAEATSEAIELDGEELEDARWVDRTTLARSLAGDRGAGIFVPPPFAIAHMLVKAWVEQG